MPILPLPDSEFSYDPDPVHSLASPFQEDTKLLRGIDSLVNQLGADFARHARESRLSDFKKPWLACIDVYHSPQGALFVEGVKRKWTELAGTGGGRVAIPAPERTLILDTSVALLDHSRLESIAKDYMTDDPVFGHVCNDLLIHSLLDSEIWEEKVVKPVERHCAGYIDGPSEVDAIIVIGVGAFAELGVREWADCAIMAMVPREHIYHPLQISPHLHSPIGDPFPQAHLLASMTTTNGPSPSSPTFKTNAWYRYKRCYYFDWPILDRHFYSALPQADYFVDLSRAFPLDVALPIFAKETSSAPTLPISVLDSITTIDTPSLFALFQALTRAPIRTRSLFMPGIWGGQRLKELVRGLGQGWMDSWENVAWGFEVVAPEIGVGIEVEGHRIEVPFGMVLEFQNTAVLGKENVRKYNKYLPIRFNYLDTEHGTNLSVQVHPPSSYIRRFGEPIGQHETYYTVEALPDSLVHLGLQADPVDRKAKFLESVARAEKEGVSFPPIEHVQAHSSKEGDLFLIPAGTVHCSGSGNLVLEISTTPYLYTFKLYDYLRLGSDGQRRPISYDRGFEVLRGERQGNWVTDRIVMRGKERLRTFGRGWARYLLSNGERLMPQEIERLEFRTGEQQKPVFLSTRRTGFLMLALTKGNGCLLSTPNHESKRQLNYAECCIIPAASGGVWIEALGKLGEEVHLVFTYIRRPGTWGRDHSVGGAASVKSWTVSLDAGGTRIKHGLVCEWAEDGRTWLEMVGEGVEAVDAGSSGSKDTLLGTLAGIISSRVSQIDTDTLTDGNQINLSFSFPGPMDYATGTPDIGAELGGKYGSISGVHLPSALSPLLPQLKSDYSWKFTNDAACAGLAETVARGCKGRSIAVTLGTGLGSCFVEDGQVLESGDGVPPNGWIYSGKPDLESWKSTGGEVIAGWARELERRSKPGMPVIADDTWSVRGLACLLRSADGESAEDKDDAELVRAAASKMAAQPKLREAIELFAGTLGDCLARFATSFKATNIVVLGGIAEGYWEHMINALEEKFAVGTSVTRGRLGRAAGVAGAVLCVLGSESL